MKKNILVLGLGAYAYGKERRAVFTFKHMPNIQPFYAVSKWGDGSVNRLLKAEGQESFYAPFGYLGRAKPLWTWVAMMHLPSLWYRMIREYLRKKCRALVFLCLSSFVSAFLPTVLLKYLLRARLVFYIGDIPQKSRLGHALGWLVDKMASDVIANSEAVKKGLAGIGIHEGKIKVVYNGKDLRSFETVSGTDFRTQFGFSPQDVIVAFIGQLSPNKGVEDFVRAAGEVLRRQNGCRFVIVGASTPHFGDFELGLRQSVKHLGLNGSVLFTGKISSVEDVYKGTDIVVVPSRHEDPAPNVIIEAMAHGIPVIATKVGGNAELVVDGRTGFLVEKRSSEEIAQRILRLVKNPALRSEMGWAGRRCAQEKFNITSNALLVERAILSP